MTLPDQDRRVIVSELGREPTPEEAALFENLWSEHCAYRSSRPLLSAFDSEGSQVVVGPGDDAAVVRVSDETAIAIGIESHNHPSYVDPYDGAATGVGGIVRDILSMGAYPIALYDCLYFGEFDDEHVRYLFEGVVEGIADYGNSIGVPTVGGSLDFHPKYEGNPLVNVGCVGVVPTDRIMRAAVTEPGNRLVLVGNATGRDGLGGASFASEDLSEDAEVEDRPAVQVGDPYTEKLLIEVNETLLEADLIEAARDLGAAGLGGATSEMVAQGDLGARVELDRVHQREPNMNALEILLSESQERMCYEVAPENVDRVREIADRYEVESSVIGEVTEDGYVCTFEGETVVDVPAEFLADGAPMNDLPAEEPDVPTRDLPTADVETAFSRVISSPNTGSREWVYRQYDHEVGVRTGLRPGDDAAVLALREADTGLALAGGAEPFWTDLAPYEGARAVGLEVATNLAAKGASPVAAVDCLNGGNPEKADVYGGFSGIVHGLADMCRALSVPIVGGNVSLYNDSASGPIPPTPTLLMAGTLESYTAVPKTVTGDGDLLLIGPPSGALGGSEYLARFGGTDGFPALPDDPSTTVESIAAVAGLESTLAAHDVSDGGLAVTLAEMVSRDSGLDVSLEGDGSPAERLFSERPGRAVVETTAPDAVRDVLPEGIAVTRIGRATGDGALSVSVDETTIERSADEIAEDRSTIERTLQ